ncbi:DUF3592 domain-containing protein [Candidatus Dojkabacteria bacterium]|nr:DUF3592 domain-containing protein [Candidatus Dojkabacteria bacterium]
MEEKMDEKKDWNAPVIIGAVVAIIGLVVLIYAFFTRQEMGKYTNSGVETQAIVVGGEMLDGDVSAYSLDVSYDDGTTATIDSYLTEELWNSYEIGDTVSVIFMPDNPQKVILAETAGLDKLSPISSYPLGLGVLAVGGGIVVVGAVVGKKSNS